ncbi:hypothetical protein ABPG75_001392 [Micractinium tetrahymenae]
MSPGWRLRRNPLAPGVPLEGTDTVEGLCALERLRLAELLRQQAAGNGAGGSGGSGNCSGSRGGNSGWRRAFTRYRGPFIEQLGLEDLKQAPKSWAVFWKGSERGAAADAYNLPASIAVLHERTEESFVTFLPNYLRLAGAVLLATFYLRPKALLGAAAVAYSMYRTVGAALERQRQELQQQQAAAAGGGANGSRAAARPPANPNEQAVNALLAVVTWLLVAYTRCLPMLLLGAAASLAAVLAHCALRRAPSEYRHKGRQLLGYTWRQVLGREPVPDGSDPRALFRELGTSCIQAARLQLRRGWLYCRYYWGLLLDGAPSSGQETAAARQPARADRLSEPAAAAKNGGSTVPSEQDGGRSAGPPKVDRRRLPKTWAAYQRRGEVSEDWRRALSEAASRRRWGLDVRYRMSLSHTGRKHSPEARLKMSAGQRRRRERERRARAAAAGPASVAGGQAQQAQQAAQQLSQDLAKEKAVIELSRLRQVVFGWMSEFQAQHGRQPSVQETQELNPVVYRAFVRYVSLRDMLRGAGAVPGSGSSGGTVAGTAPQPPDGRLRAEGLRVRRPGQQLPQAGGSEEQGV